MDVTPQQKLAVVSALVGAMFGIAAGISFANLSEDDTAKICSRLLAGDYEEVGKRRLASQLGFDRPRSAHLYCRHSLGVL